MKKMVWRYLIIIVFLEICKINEKFLSANCSVHNPPSDTANSSILFVPPKAKEKGQSPTDLLLQVSPASDHRSTTGILAFDHHCHPHSKKKKKEKEKLHSVL